jgi:hypothetical protein
MKKIIKAAEKEEAIYYTDFKGKFCGDSDTDFSIPPVDLRIQFNYTSKHDGAVLSLHLDDEEIVPILDTIKQHMSEDYKKNLQQRLESTERNFEESMQMRDWESCDHESNSLHLLKYMLDIKES